MLQLREMHTGSMSSREMSDRQMVHAHASHSPNALEDRGRIYGAVAFWRQSGSPLAPLASFQTQPPPLRPLGCLPYPSIAPPAASLPIPWECSGRGH